MNRSIDQRLESHVSSRHARFHAARIRTDIPPARQSLTVPAILISWNCLFCSNLIPGGGKCDFDWL